MRLIATAPGQPRVPEQLPAVPPVDLRYAPPGRRRLPGSAVWLMILAGAIAGTMWMAATPPKTNCVTVPKLNQCTLQKVYLAQATKVVAGAAGGLVVALLLEGVAGAVAPTPRRRVVAAANAKPMQAPQKWGEVPTVRPKRPRLPLGEPVLARPALAPDAVKPRAPLPTTFLSSGRFARPAGVPSAMDLSSLPPQLRNAVSVPPTLNHPNTK
jgi:hypothetical protein